MKTVQLHITGMHCEACIRLIKAELKEIEGVSDVNIDFKSGVARIESTEAVTPRQLIAAVQAAGYTATHDQQHITAGNPPLVASSGVLSVRAIVVFGAVFLAGVMLSAAVGNENLRAALLGDNPQASAGSDGAACPVNGESANCLMPSAVPLKPGNDPSPSAETVTYDAEKNLQTVRMTQSAFGFEPNSFEIKKGVPVKWVIDSETSYSCAASIRMREFDILKSLEKGENIIEFTPQKAGVLPFSCGMGMVTGQFIVTE